MFVYKITNIINNKCYIGKAEISIESRFKKHLRSAKYKDNKHLYDSMNHYGYENFKVEEIEKCNSIKELNEREIFWIKYYNSTDRNFGYNFTSGGTGGNTFTYQNDIRKKEILKKRSESMRGKNKGPKSKETILKRKMTMIKNGNYGFNPYKNKSEKEKSLSRQKAVQTIKIKKVSCDGTKYMTKQQKILFYKNNSIKRQGTHYLRKVFKLILFYNLLKRES